ncbi:cytochrome c oxidase assembly protein COX18, mitochondrial-like [Clavelina lepadiformis]|uniref:cytochrome c oxidase assembly protein COX18, mitochondrial-like n=1 Tax=Clavelina lepadiformis TaxID=159417 RepID=UPI00404298E6
MISTHDLTGLPWWASIGICTVFLRVLIMTPMMVVQMRSNIKYQQYLHIFRALQQRLTTEINKVANEQHWDDSTKLLQYQLNLQRHRTKLMTKYKVPGVFKRYLLPWIQIPVWISMSISLRHLTLSLPLTNSLSPELLSVASQMSHEGCLWFSNLCLPDPFYVMPPLLGIINLSIIEIHRGDGKTKTVGFGKVLINTARTLSVLMIPIACYMPSGVVLYWLCSSTYGAFQALAFRSPNIRTFFRIPVSNMESKTPYRDLFIRLPFMGKRKL